MEKPEGANGALRRRRRASRLARGIALAVAAFFFVTGAVKLLDVDSFAKKVAEFGIVADGILWTVALVLALAEVQCALLLVWRPRLGFPFTLALLLVFVGVLGYGIYIGLDVDCGCLPFGIYESLQVALIRDLVLIACCVFAWSRCRAPRPEDHVLEDHSPEEP